MKKFFQYVLFAFLIAVPVAVFAADKGTNKKNKGVASSDIAAAVKATAVKDCGCGECAAKGCKPCHGKNCYYCVAKGLVTKECGCGMCNAKGCGKCGPGCDVCKFHLAPLAQAKEKEEKK